MSGDNGSVTGGNTGSVNSGNATMVDVGNAAVAASGLLSSIITNRANRKEAQRAREWQEKMWNMANEYNLPVNQVSRLKDAGINPNIAFGSAASTMAANIPASPARANYDYTGIAHAAQNAFRNKLERLSVLSQVNEQREETRSKKLNNDLLESLLEEKRAAMLWGWRADAAKNKWFAGHNDEWYGAELTGKWFKNDLTKAERDLAEARRTQTIWAWKRAMQDYEHLANKYAFEDTYYKNHLNPYETSTVAGFYRTLLGTRLSFVDYINDVASSAVGGKLPKPWLIPKMVISLFKRKRK